jgi:hypothetical protein
MNNNTLHKLCENFVCRSKGVQKVVEPTGWEYFLPKSQDWEYISPFEEEGLDFDPSDFSDTISFLKVDPYIRSLFWEKVFPVLETCAPEARSGALENFKDLIISKLESYSKILCSKYYSHELVFNPPHKLSTAFDHLKKRTIGLHIDIHNVKKPEEAEGGFQLVGINLGCSHRYFYFINKTVKQLISELGGIYSDVGRLRTDYLRRYSEGPLYRLKIPPDYAYIANSQNFIHDGGTNENGDIDVAFLLGGYFEQKD